MLTRRVILIATATLAAALPTMSSSQASSEQSERFVAMTRRPLKYDLKPERVDVRRDVAVGKRADGSALTLDLYLPKKPGATPQPVVLLLHGGLPDEIPIRPTQWQVYQDWGTVLAASPAVQKYTMVVPLPLICDGQDCRRSAMNVLSSTQPLVESRKRRVVPSPRPSGLYGIWEVTLSNVPSSFRSTDRPKKSWICGSGDGTLCDWLHVPSAARANR